jgi:hypothetical protein
MSWLPVFASYAMPALLLLALSVVNRLRDSRQEVPSVRSRRSTCARNWRRHHAMSGDGR